jgi:hypothetical protein
MNCKQYDLAMIIRGKYKGHILVCAQLVPEGTMLVNHHYEIGTTYNTKDGWLSPDRRTYCNDCDLKPMSGFREFKGIEVIR